MPRAKKYRQWSRRIERNILACYHRANDSDRLEGLHWYANAHAIGVNMAEKYKVSLKTAIGVLAALSPGNEWGRNVIEADLFIKEWSHGSRGRQLPIVGVYGKRNIIKAVKILSGLDPLLVLPETGPKVRAFYQAILEPITSMEVCVDRHAKCLSYNIREDRDKGGIVRLSEYNYLAWHYQKLAERLGLLPHQLQGTAWCVWRRLKGQLEQSDLPF